MVSELDKLNCSPDGCLTTPVEVVGARIDRNALACPVLEVVSDVVCPWCYIGKRRLEKALMLLGPAVAVKVRWRPFELNPDMPPEGMDRAAYCERKFGSLELARELYANCAANATGEGLPMAPERIVRMPNTRPAHRLIWLAERHDVQNALVDALFAAYFFEGRDIGDPDVLADAAVAAGLDRLAVRAFLASGDGEAAVYAEEHAAQRLGIDGVPAFVMNGRRLFTGAQVPATMAIMLEAALMESR